MKREERYLVFKITDTEKYISNVDFRNLLKLSLKIRCGRQLDEKEPLECVVVEHDWPEYEPVWKMIEERVNKNSITKEEFRALQREWEGLEMDIAQGQDTPESDLRIREIEEIMKNSKWKFAVDSNEVDEDVNPVRVYIKKNARTVQEALEGFFWNSCGGMDHMPGNVFDVKESRAHAFLVWQDANHSNYWTFHMDACIIVES